MKIAFLLLAAMTATAASAQQPPAYGQPSAVYGSPLPDVTNNPGFANRRFDNDERQILPTFKRHAARAHAAAKRADAPPRS